MIIKTVINSITASAILLCVLCIFLPSTAMAQSAAVTSNASVNAMLNRNADQIMAFEKLCTQGNMAPDVMTSLLTNMLDQEVRSGAITAADRPEAENFLNQLVNRCRLSLQLDEVLEKAANDYAQGKITSESYKNIYKTALDQLQAVGYITQEQNIQFYAEFSANIDASEAAKNPANQPAATVNTPAPNNTTQPSINTSPEPDNIITPPINPTPEPNTTAQPTVNTQLSQNNTTQPSVNTSNEPYTTAQPNVDTQPAPNNTTQPNVDTQPAPNNTTQPSVNTSNEPNLTIQPSVNTSNEPNHTEQPDVDTQTEANHTAEPTDTTSSPQKARSKKSNIESLAHIFALSTMFSPGVIPLSDSEVGNFLDGFTTISGDIFSYSGTIRLGYSLIIKMAYHDLSDTRLDCIDAGDETICHRASEHYEHFFGFGLYLRQDFIGALGLNDRKEKYGLQHLAISSFMAELKYFIFNVGAGVGAVYNINTPENKEKLFDGAKLSWMLRLSADFPLTEHIMAGLSCDLWFLDAKNDYYLYVQPGISLTFYFFSDTED